TAQTLSEVSGGPERAEALLAMGKLLVQAKKLGEAIQPLASAVALVGLEPPDAALELKKVLEAEGGNSAGWAGYAKALETYCSEHTSELQSRENLVCRLLLEKKKQTLMNTSYIVTLL